VAGEDVEMIAVSVDNGNPELRLERALLAR